jgi:hypothetical protein
MLMSLTPQSERPPQLCEYRVAGAASGQTGLAGLTRLSECAWGSLELFSRAVGYNNVRKLPAAELVALASTVPELPSATVPPHIKSPHCEIRVLLFHRPAPRLRDAWLTIEWPAISHFDMAGLFIPYLSRNIPKLPIAIGGTLRGH